MHLELLDLSEMFKKLFLYIMDLHTECYSS